MISGGVLELSTDLIRSSNVFEKTIGGQILGLLATGPKGRLFVTSKFSPILHYSF
jgi:hypothetical protein